MQLLPFSFLSSLVLGLQPESLFFPAPSPRRLEEKNLLPFDRWPLELKESFFMKLTQLVEGTGTFQLPLPVPLVEEMSLFLASWLEENDFEAEPLERPRMFREVDHDGAKLLQVMDVTNATEALKLREFRRKILQFNPEWVQPYFQDYAGELMPEIIPMRVRMTRTLDSGSRRDGAAIQLGRTGYCAVSANC